MNKILMVIGATIFLMFTFAIGSSQVALAHFDVKDPETGLEARFHATPDHSPIAGSNSVISYDFGKVGYEAEDFTYALAIAKTREGKVNIPVKIFSNVVIADFKFPTQGLYTLTLHVTPKDDNKKSSVLVYSQRVSRGELAKNSEFGSFEMGVLAVVLGTVGIVFTITFKNSFIKAKKKRGI